MAQLLSLPPWSLPLPLLPPTLSPGCAGTDHLVLRKTQGSLTTGRKRGTEEEEEEAWVGGQGPLRRKAQPIWVTAHAYCDQRAHMVGGWGRKDAALNANFSNLDLNYA